jgi:putative transposase
LVTGAVVIGVDENDLKSVLAMIQGDKDAKSAWEMVFFSLKERGLDSQAVQLGVMDGLPGLPDAFLNAFPNSQVARCWIHKARNVMPLVAHRYQADFKVSWDAVAYASGRIEAMKAFSALKLRWGSLAKDAVARMEKDLEMLLVHYDFPRAYWSSLRTTNPIERVNKELKRRSKAMEQHGSENLKALLAFTALRLEYGWSMMPVTSTKMNNLDLSPYRLPAHEDSLEAAIRGLAI